jgi:hypothetical protein
METPDLLTAGREAFASQDWAATVDALGSTGALPPDASEALAKARWWLDTLLTCGCSSRRASNPVVRGF